MEFSIKESVKTIAKSSPRNILFITFIFLLPLSLFQMLFIFNLLKIGVLLSNQSNKPMISYFIYNFVYLVLFLVFYLLSTSSVIFTMASRYVSKPISCVATIFAIPRLSKRILITFFYALPLMIFAYLANLANMYLFFTIIAKMNSANAIAVIFAIIYDLFFVYVAAYIIVLWNLANVISVLEPSIHGLTTMKMSKQLLRANSRDAFLFVDLYLIVASVIPLFAKFAVFMEYDYYIIGRILLAFSVIFMAGVNLVCLIAQCDLYYACKNYHNQVIDKEVLYGHLSGKESGNKEH